MLNNLLNINVNGTNYIKTNTGKNTGAPKRNTVSFGQEEANPKTETTDTKKNDKKSKLAAGTITGGVLFVICDIFSDIFIDNFMFNGSSGKKDDNIEDILKPEDQDKMLDDITLEDENKYKISTKTKAAFDKFVKNESGRKPAKPAHIEKLPASIKKFTMKIK